MESQGGRFAPQIDKRLNTEDTEKRRTRREDSERKAKGS